MVASYSAGLGLAMMCTAQFMYSSTLKLTLKQTCFMFQGTALNMPLTQALAARPFRKVACKAPQEALQSRHSHQCHHTRAEQVSCFWQKPEPGRTRQDAAAVVKFGHPLLILPQYKSREIRSLTELKKLKTQHQ